MSAGGDVLVVDDDVMCVTSPAATSAGQQTLPFGDRLRALPIDALWRTAP